MVRKKKFLTFLLALMPGVGHLYLGLTKRGLQLMISAFACISLISFLPRVFPFVLAVIWFFSLFDALQKVSIINDFVTYQQKQMNDSSQFNEDSSLQSLDKSIIAQLQFTKGENWIEPLWLGIACIIVGILIFVRESFPDIWYWLNQIHFESMLLAIILIGFGIWLIRKQSRKP